MGTLRFIVVLAFGVFGTLLTTPALAGKKDFKTFNLDVKFVISSGWKATPEKKRIILDWIDLSIRNAERL